MNKEKIDGTYIGAGLYLFYENEEIRLVKDDPEDQEAAIFIDKKMMQTILNLIGWKNENSQQP